MKKSLFLLAASFALLAGCKEKNVAQGSQSAENAQGESSAGDSAWFMAQTERAEVESVVATSELVEAQFEGRYLYPPINILDGDFDSTWCEADKNGSGIGESITVEFSEPVSFDEIQIVNGFASKDYYMKNNRVKSILLTQTATKRNPAKYVYENGGSHMEIKKHYQQKEYTLEDGKAEWQSIHFDLPQTAQTLTIKITDVYRGEKYDDTCLDDIRLLYQGKVIPFVGVSELKEIQEAASRKMIERSDGKSFREEFFALFGKNSLLILKGSGDEFIYVLRDSYSDERISYWRLADGEYRRLVEAKPTAKEMDEVLLKTFNVKKSEEGNWSGERSDFISHDGGEPNYSNENGEYDYVLIGSDFYGRERKEYEIGNHRLLTTEYIDYVATTTATILDIEGNTVFVNGVPYTAVSGDRVFNALYSEL